MAKVHPQVSEHIKSLNKKELEKLVLKAAASYKPFHEFLLVNIDHAEEAVEDLFESYKKQIDALQVRSFYGNRRREKQEAKKLQECGKLITAFDKNCKDKRFTVELMLYTLQFQIEITDAAFGTYYQPYDNKVRALIEKVLKFATTKIHEDLLMDYKNEIQKYMDWFNKSQSVFSIIKWPESN